MTEVVPRVGVAVILGNAEREVLLGQRAGSHGAQTWAFPGGALVAGEAWYACARRELAEETGLTAIGQLRVVAVTNDVIDGGRSHWVTITVAGRLRAGVPRRMEPDRCHEWRWVRWGEWPRPLFVPAANVIRSLAAPAERGAVALADSGAGGPETDALAGASREAIMDGEAI